MPRDLNRRSALIIGTAAVEMIDIEEYLVGRGWNRPTTVPTLAAALTLFRAQESSFSLVVVTVSHSHLSILDFARYAGDAGARLMIVNGAQKVQLSENVVTIRRPFHDQDLDDAMKQLGLAEV